MPTIKTDGKWHMAGSATIDNVSIFFTNNPTVTTLWKYVNGKWMSVSAKEDIQESIDTATIDKVNNVTTSEGFMYK